jgi:hypothetical protein
MYTIESFERCQSLSEDDDAGTHDQDEKVMVQSSLRIMIVNPMRKKDFIMAKIDKSALQKGIYSF